MKAIQTHTAVIKNDNSRADSGEILSIPGDISAERAKALVAAGSAAEHVEEGEETPKSKAKA